MASNVVLVTGGNGFLGQHVIKHLQLFTDDIKEIRVLDCVPFQQKLEYDAKKTVTSIIGSITNKQIVEEACCNVNCILHLASKIDVSLFPDKDAMHEVNVKGTDVIINACKQQNVQFLIYCGSLGAFYGKDEVKGGTETSVPFPTKSTHGEYGETKRCALKMVMAANDEALRNGMKLKTLGILPSAMYGELDPHNIRSKSRLATDGIYKRVLGPMDAKIQYSYVGNVSMMFVRAYQALQKNLELGGNYFFGVDDTPAQSHFEFRRPFLQENVTLSSWYVPSWVVCAIFSIIYFALLLLRPLKRINIPFASDAVHFINTTFYVKYDKAKTLLGYVPLYDYKSSVQKTKSSLFSSS